MALVTITPPRRFGKRAMLLHQIEEQLKSGEHVIVICPDPSQKRWMMNHLGPAKNLDIVTSNVSIFESRGYG